MSFFKEKDFTFNWKVFVPHIGWTSGSSTVKGNWYFTAKAKIYEELRQEYKDVRGANVFVLNQI